jgi:hypothetical protein
MFLSQLYNRYPHLKYEEELLFSDELTEQEKEVVFSLAKLAGEIIHKFPHCPMGADQLIKQHHGVTNGVAIGLSQLISSKSWGKLEKMLARTGLFTDPEAQYGDWSNTPGNYDSYQDTSLSWVSKLRDIHTAFVTGDLGDELPKKVHYNVKNLKDAGITERQLNAARSLVGTFREKELDSFGNTIVSKVGRALAKNPLMITNYGAAMAKVIQEFVGEIVSKIHKNAADAQNKIEEGKAEGNSEKIAEGQIELAN